MTVTRFCPTANNGELHFGHLINAYANLIWAKKNKGKFFVKAEYQKAPDAPYSEQQLKFYGDNIQLLKQLFPRTPIVSTVEAGPLVLDGIRNPMMISAAVDMKMGTTDFIRGHDWSDGHPMMWETPQWTATEFGFVFSAIYEKMSGITPNHYYTPLLTFKGKKVMKLKPTPELYVSTLLKKHTMLSLMTYACHILGWQPVVETFDTFVARFDLDKVGERLYFEHEEYLLMDSAEWAVSQPDPDETYREYIQW